MSSVIVIVAFSSCSLKNQTTGSASGKESACQCRRCKTLGFDPWVGKIPMTRKWQPTPEFLPGKFHGQRSLAATVHGVAKRRTQLRARGRTHTHTHTHTSLHSRKFSGSRSFIIQLKPVHFLVAQYPGTLPPLFINILVYDPSPRKTPLLYP